MVTGPWARAPQRQCYGERVACAQLGFGFWLCFPLCGCRGDTQPALPSVKWEWSDPFPQGGWEGQVESQVRGSKNLQIWGSEGLSCPCSGQAPVRSVRTTRQPWESGQMKADLLHPLPVCPLPTPCHPGSLHCVQKARAASLPPPAAPGRVTC